jgi:outer membrane receptor protein involved in Fe transport
VPVDRNDDPTSQIDSRPAYSLFDLRTGVSFDNLDLTLWVENLANKRTEVSSQPDSVLGRRVIFTAPRTIGVNASYVFR